MFSFLPSVLVFVCLHGVFGQQLLPSSPELSFRPTFLGQAIAEALFLLIMQERSRPLFFPVPIGSPRARVFRSKTVLCNSFQQSNNPPLQRSSSLIQLTSQNSSPNQQRAPQVIGVMQSQNSSAGNRGPRPLEQVTCYKVSPRGGVGWDRGDRAGSSVGGHSLTPQMCGCFWTVFLLLLI